MEHLQEELRLRVKFLNAKSFDFELSLELPWRFRQCSYFSQKTGIILLLSVKLSTNFCKITDIEIIM